MSAPYLIGPISPIVRRRPSDGIWALVAGFPKPQREKRPLAMMLAHIDDSGKGHGPVFIMGGFVGTAENWAKFSDEWADALAESPSIQYFKMREAASRDGEFAKFIDDKQRDKKIELLSSVLNKYASFGVACTVVLPHYYAVMRGVFGKTMDSPTYHGCNQILFLTTQKLQFDLINDRVDFIFDVMDDTTFIEILRHWRMAKEGWPRNLRKRLGQPPIMRDDTEVLPLQSAELIIWHARRLAEDMLVKKLPSDQSRAWQVPLLTTVPIVSSNWDLHSLSRLRQEMERRIPTESEYESAKARSKRLEIDRKILRERKDK